MVTISAGMTNGVRLDCGTARGDGCHATNEQPGSQITLSGVASPDERWIASANPVGGESDGQGRMVLWNLDSNEVVNLGRNWRTDTAWIEITIWRKTSVSRTLSSARTVGFSSFETAHPGFVESDRNHASDVFRYSIDTGEILLVSERNPELPHPQFGITVTAPMTSDRLPFIYYKHSLDPSEPWIRSSSAREEDGIVTLEENPSILHDETYYKAEKPSA